jgi:hypothetical protein
MSEHHPEYLSRNSNSPGSPLTREVERLTRKALRYRKQIAEQEEAEIHRRKGDTKAGL